MSDGFKKMLVSTADDSESLLGRVELSILSAQLAFSSFGAGLDSVVHARKHIDGITATLWSMIPMTIRAAKGNGAALQTLDMLLEQLPKQLEKYMSILDIIEEEAKKEKKDDAAHA